LPEAKLRGQLAAMTIHTIATGDKVSLRLAAGETIRVIDPQGGQACDLTAFCAGDRTEWLSNGRSFDYGSKIYFSTGDVLYSNLSRPMFTIVRDDVGRHDFLYTACSREMYRIQYGITGDPPNCLDNLGNALGVASHQVPTPFNIFMNAAVSPDGRIVISPPLTRAGDAIWLRAELDLDVAVSACPGVLCNGGYAKPIAYEVLAA
jgi:uncharacterized protein YcgI (DUF1989 family)